MATVKLGRTTVYIPLFTLPGELIVKICTYGLSVRDAVNFSLTCKALDVIIGGVIPSSNTKELWDLFLEKDFPEVVRTPVYFEMSHNRRALYIALARSRFSAVGLPFPGCPLNLKKLDQSQRQRIQHFKEANRIRPFWSLQLHHTNSRTRRVACEYTYDPTSYFQTVLHLNELNRLLVEGCGMVWIPGYYQVRWRIKLSADYALGTLQFITKVLRDENERGAWDDDEMEILTRTNSEVYQRFWFIVNDYERRPPNISTNVWFDLNVGTVFVEKPKTTVFFSVMQSYHDWKYGLYIDYVQLWPITEAEFRTAQQQTCV